MCAVRVTRGASHSRARLVDSVGRIIVLQSSTQEGGVERVTVTVTELAVQCTQYLRANQERHKITFFSVLINKSEISMLRVINK